MINGSFCVFFPCVLSYCISSDSMWVGKFCSGCQANLTLLLSDGDDDAAAVDAHDDMRT